MTVEADIARQMLDGSIDEFTWQQTVVDEGMRLGWEVHFEPHWYWRAIREWLERHPNYWRYIERTKRGWPDLTMWHLGHKRTVFAELKTETGVVKPDQVERLTQLWQVGNEVYVWRPRHRDQVDRILRGDPREDVAIELSKRRFVTDKDPILFVPNKDPIL